MAGHRERPCLPGSALEPSLQGLLNFWSSSESPFSLLGLQAFVWPTGVLGLHQAPPQAEHGTPTLDIELYQKILGFTAPRRVTAVVVKEASGDTLLGEITVRAGRPPGRHYRRCTLRAVSETWKLA